MLTMRGECKFWPHAIGHVAGPGENAEPAKPFAARLGQEPDALDRSATASIACDACGSHSRSRLAYRRAPNVVPNLDPKSLKKFTRAPETAECGQQHRTLSSC